MLLSALLLAACHQGNIRGDLNDDERGGLVRPDVIPGDDDTGDTGDTGPADVVDEACYPGPNGTGGLCIDLVEPATMPSGYAYPAPYQGNANYRAPVAWLDLDAVDGAQKLAPNFRLDEFAQAYKGRYGVVQPHLVEHLQAIRDDLGALVVNSGYRNPGWNDDIGGATWSRHMYGDAADIDPVSASLTALGDACGAEGAGYVQLYATHVHCDWRHDTVHPGFYGPAGRAAIAWDLPEVDAFVAWDGDLLIAPATGFDEGEPLRIWTARDADGAVVAHAIGETFEPPARAAEVTVEVGGLVVRSVALR